MTTIDDDFWSRRNVLNAGIRIGIGLVGAGIILGGLYLGINETMRYQAEYIKRFVTTLAENQRRDPQQKYHLLIAYDRWDRIPGPGVPVAPTIHAVPKNELEAVVQWLAQETAPDHKERLRRRYDSMTLANTIAQESQHAGIKHTLIGTQRSPSLNDLLIKSLSSEDVFAPTHVLYTNHAIDPTVARQAEEAYLQTTELRPESLRVTKTMIDNIK